MGIELDSTLCPGCLEAVETVDHAMPILDMIATKRIVPAFSIKRKTSSLSKIFIRYGKENFRRLSCPFRAATCRFANAKRGFQPKKPEARCDDYGGDDSRECYNKSAGRLRQVNQPPLPFTLVTRRDVTSSLTVPSGKNDTLTFLNYIACNQVVSGKGSLPEQVQAAALRGVFETLCGQLLLKVKLLSDARFGLLFVSSDMVRMAPEECPVASSHIVVLLPLFRRLGPEIDYNKSIRRKSTQQEIDYQIDNQEIGYHISITRNR
ncbi:hypothetical protein OSB04_019887 [Centaurea solstitialis]|uniref:Uncharacterized protein n=1 Tax=Centaurea solstitialis TaxID=347529 RepID=A0AA38SSU2_9ASTR|nr:hypothetical protein OSB04_019887 [Centaurea solstitialis]